MGEMRDFQLSWFKSGVPHIDIPQDHAFIATLYNFAEKMEFLIYLMVEIFLLNASATRVLYYGTDMKHIHDIIRRFGTIEMKTYPFSSILRHKLYLRYIRKVKVFRPLNYRPYRKPMPLVVVP